MRSMLTNPGRMPGVRGLVIPIAGHSLCVAPSVVKKSDGSGLAQCRLHEISTEFTR